LRNTKLKCVTSNKVRFSYNKCTNLVLINTVIWNLDPVISLTDEQFYQLCMANNAQAEWIIVPPVGEESEPSEADLIIKAGKIHRIYK
jgi:hypothetical protein